MSFVFVLLQNLLFIYLLILFARLVFDYVFLFAREWRPKGPVVFLLEVIYSLTDPPLRALRRVIPPLRIGGISLDVAFMILMIIVIIGMNLAATLAHRVPG